MVQSHADWRSSKARNRRSASCESRSPLRQSVWSAESSASTTWFLWQSIQQLQKNSICPSESYDVIPVAFRQLYVRGVRDHVIFLANRPVAHKIIQHHGEKFTGDAVRIRVV